MAVKPGKCEICETKAIDGVIPNGKKIIKPVLVCYDCAIKHCSTVFYDGFPVFHFRSESGNWYFVFIHHDHLVPYFYPTPSLNIEICSTEKHGQLLVKKTTGKRQGLVKKVGPLEIPYKMVVTKQT
jgi:hypothetical protein